MVNKWWQIIWLHAGLAMAALHRNAADI